MKRKVEKTAHIYILQSILPAQGHLSTQTSSLCPMQMLKLVVEALRGVVQTRKGKSPNLTQPTPTPHI